MIYFSSHYFLLKIMFNLQIFKSHPAVKENRHKLEDSVVDWTLSPATASDILLSKFVKD